MVCCWAGNDDIFNGYERARAWGIYTSFPVFSLSIMYCMYYFHRTRKNFEMITRGPPTSMILILVTVWVSIFMEAMTHLTRDLELASEDWQEFMNQNQMGVTSVLETVADTCWAFCLAIYVFRIWMFWYKSGMNQVVQSFGDAAKTKDKKKRLSYFLKRRKYLQNKKFVALVCFIWAVILMIPVVVIDLIINSAQNRMQMLRIILSAVVAIPVIVFMIGLTLNVKNKFGVVREYKVLVLAFACSVGMNFLLLTTPLADTYYRLLIGFEFRMFVAFANYIWLMFFLRQFDIENLCQKKNSSSVKTFCADIWHCCKVRLSLKSPKSESFWDYSLDEVLSHKIGFALFCDHVKETLCTENLFFFLDVYRHRKSLNNDPFIELSKDASCIVQSCSMLKMDWIDEEIIKQPTVVPTCRQIYELYVEPSSEMEINIPGWMRKQIVNVFDEKKSARTSWNMLAIRSDSKPTIELTERVSTRPWMDSLIQRTRSTFNWRNGSTGTPGDPCYDYKRDKLSVLTTISTAGNESLPLDGHLGTSSIRTVKSIEHLYPAWSTLVSLLNNDSLVRFKIGLYSSATWRGR